jgi:hypothetical protein
MMDNEIKCGDLFDFAMLCAYLQKEGIKFHGDTNQMVVVITGY